MKINKEEVMTSTVTKMVENSITAWDKVKHFFEDLGIKEQIDYGIAYETYLRNTKRKYSKIKTLIYRHTPKELYSFYECIGVKCDGNIVDTSNINNIIKNEDKVIITGTGGIGKTTLLRHLFLNSIDQTSFIPIFIELRGFNIVDIKEISLYEYIYKTLVDNGFKLSKEYFEYSMNKGGYIILLDGFDEVNKEKKIKITNEIKSVSGKYNENKFILTSRPADEFIGWNDFVEMRSLKLSKEQALSLVSKIEFDENTKTIFYKELKESLYDKYESFASNPLLLTIMLLTFSNHASIPDKLNDFYEQAFATLFNMHDATKDAYVRDIRSGLGCEDFKLIFSYICFKSYFADQLEFTEIELRNHIKKAQEKFSNIHFGIDEYQEDLISAVCMLIKEGINYRFSHRSFQEYFAAWYTCKLTDDVQCKLISSWLKESDACISDSYIKMLFNLQSEKVNKIILCPGLKELKNMYQTKGFTVEFLDELFVGIRVGKSEMGDGYKYRVSLKIKESYLCHVLLLTCRLHGRSYIVEDEVTEQKFAKAVYEYAEKENRSPVRFEEAKIIVGDEVFLKGLDWVRQDILFGFDILEKHTNPSINKKKKVNTILEEL